MAITSPMNHPLMSPMLVAIARLARQPDVPIPYAPSVWFRAKSTPRHRARWSRTCVDWPLLACSVARPTGAATEFAESRLRSAVGTGFWRTAARECFSRRRNCWSCQDHGRVI